METKIYTIFWTLVIFVTGVSSVASESNKESHYSDFWCIQQGGNASMVLEDGTKPDCILDDEVIEFDWGKGNKPYECVGQVLHYAHVSGKAPVCALIQSPFITSKTFYKAVEKVKGGDVKVICINANKQTFSCL